MKRIIGILITCLMSCNAFEAQAAFRVAEDGGDMASRQYCEQVVRKLNQAKGKLACGALQTILGEAAQPRWRAWSKREMWANRRVLYSIDEQTLTLSRSTTSAEFAAAAGKYFTDLKRKISVGQISVSEAYLNIPQYGHRYRVLRYRIAACDPQDPVAYQYFALMQRSATKVRQLWLSDPARPHQRTEVVLDGNDALMLTETDEGFFISGRNCRIDLLP